LASSYSGGARNPRGHFRASLAPVWKLGARKLTKLTAPRFSFVDGFGGLPSSARRMPRSLGLAHANPVKSCASSRGRRSATSRSRLEFWRYSAQLLLLLP